VFACLFLMLVQALESQQRYDSHATPFIERLEVEGNRRIQRPAIMAHIAARVVPKIARLTRFDPIAQSRRSASQQRQAANRRAWNQSENPEWLNEEFYRERILCRLMTAQVSDIQSALSVSGAYALMIQTGRRVPHRRHWKTLARLAGFFRRVSRSPRSV
jgi:hypothetical protein